MSKNKKDTQNNALSIIQKDELRNNLKDAVNAGVPEAQYEMAILHLEEKKISEALKLLEASHKSMDKSAFKLGKLYSNGKIVKKDIKKALEYYNTAYKLGNIEAAFELALLHSTDTNKNLKIKDNNKAIEYFNEVTKEGDEKHKSKSHFNLGKIYLEKGDIDRAQSNLITAYKQYKNYNAARILGKMYFEGENKNYKISFSFFEVAANNNDPESTYFLSKFYINKLGETQKNVTKGLELLEKASDLGYTDAIFEMSELYLDHKFEKYNPSAAKEQLLKLAKKDYSKAQHKLSEIYFHDGDFTNGFMYLEQAANNGNIEAKFDLGKKILSNCKLESEKSYFHFLFGTDNEYCSTGISSLEDNARKNTHIESINTLIQIYEGGNYHNKKVCDRNTDKLKELIEIGKSQRLPIALYYSAKTILDNADKKTQESTLNIAKNDLIYASDSGYLDAMLYYSQLLTSATHFKFNPTLGNDLIVTAAEKGHYESQYTLGINNYKESFPIKCEIALRWLTKAVYNTVNPVTGHMQSILDKYSINVEISDHDSFKSAYKQISLKLHPDKNSALKSRFSEKEMSSDFDIAKLIYQDKYDINDLPESKHKLFDDAEYTIAEIYYKGCKDIKSDVSQALKWYKKAAEKGNAHAKFELYKIQKEYPSAKDKSEEIEEVDTLNLNTNELEESHNHDKAEL